MMVSSSKDPDGTFTLEVDGKVMARGFRRPTEAGKWAEQHGYATDEPDDPEWPSEEAWHMEALGWAFTDPATQEAYRRCTGEDIATILNSYRQWAEANMIGDGHV